MSRRLSSPGTRIGAAFSPKGRLRETVKLAPWPGALRAVRRPPINSTRSRLIARPRPEPPYRALTPSAVWSNGLNSRAS